MESSALDTTLVYLGQGGTVMWPLAGGALVLWYAMGYRFFTLRPGLLEAPRARALELGQGRPRYLRQILDEEFSEVEDEMKRFRVLVDVITAAAPLAGLLGTVAGMIETFDGMAEMALFTRSGGVAGGISQALFTTQMGLAVAIPGLLAGRLLRRREDQLADELERIKDLAAVGALS